VCVWGGVGVCGEIENTRNNNNKATPPAHRVYIL